MSYKKFYDFITPCDLMRYLMPGVILLFCIFLFEIWAATVLVKTILEKGPCCTPFITTINLIEKNIGINLKNGNWMHILLFLILGLIVAYITGHIISTFSSLLVDRVLIEKGWGYPYEHILNIKNKKNAPRLAHYKFFWVNFFLILSYFIFFIICYLNVKIGNSVYTLVLHIIIIFFIFIMIPFLGQKKLSDSSEHSFLVIDKPYIVIKSILEFFLGKSFINLEIEPQFINLFKRYFVIKFKYRCKKAKTNNFWFPYLFLKNEAGIIGDNIISWRRLITYTRNLSTALYFGFLYSFGWLLCHFHFLCIEQVGLDLIHKRQLIILWMIPFLYFMAFMIMLLRYIYLNGSCFTKLVFRSFVLSCNRNCALKDGENATSARE